MKIILNESQVLKLKEARMDGFRLDVLRDMSLKDRVAYCRKWLGFPIGNGSSRMVFQLDDYSCLKLAKNGKGIKQNEEEVRIGTYNFINAIPKVLNGTDEDNYLWVVTEYVLPAKKEDFQACYNIPWNDVYEYIIALSDSVSSDRFLCKYGSDKVDELYRFYYDNEDVVTLFNDIQDLQGSYDNAIGDLRRIENWGMIKRPTGPEMVILDVGLSYEVFRNYYARR